MASLCESQAPIIIYMLYLAREGYVKGIVCYSLHYWWGLSTSYIAVQSSFLPAEVFCAGAAFVCIVHTSWTQGSLAFSLLSHQTKVYSTGREQCTIVHCRMPYQYLVANMKPEGLDSRTIGFWISLTPKNHQKTTKTTWYWSIFDSPLAVCRHWGTLPLLRYK